MAVFSNSRLAPGVHRHITDADVVALTIETVQTLNVLTAETLSMLDDAIESETARHGGAPTIGITQRSPAPLPSLQTAFSRRRAIFGAVALAAVPAVVLAGQGDARLGALAAQLIATQTAVTTHRGEDDEFDAKLDRLDALTVEMEQTPATTLAGVLHKLRVIDLPDLGENQNAHGVMVSICADVARLYAAGSLHG